MKDGGNTGRGKEKTENEEEGCCGVGAGRGRKMVRRGGAETPGEIRKAC